VVQHPAGLDPSSPLLLFEKIHGETVIAFAQNRTLGVRNDIAFEATSPRPTCSRAYASTASLPRPSQGSLPARAGSPLAGRDSHPLDDERSFTESSQHLRSPSTSRAWSHYPAYPHLTAVLDNTSQVHCNQFMIDQDPERYIGGQLIVFGGIPFTLCLGLSSPDVGDNALGDIAYRTGRHTAPLFAGDTVFAATEVTGQRDYPGRPDLGILDTLLLGHKFERAPGASQEDAPPGWKRTRIFELERSIAVKRRSHYRS